MHPRYAEDDAHWRRFLFYGYPGVQEWRGHVARLPTSRDRILTIKNISIDIINAACAAIIEELKNDRSVIANLEIHCSLNDLIADLNAEFVIRMLACRGWVNMIGLNYSLKISVESLEQQTLTLAGIVITDNTQHLWQELADWFAAKYLAFTMKDNRQQAYKKNRLGYYPFLDFNDRLFWLYTDVRQLDVLMPYRQMSRIINQRIKMHERREDNAVFVLEPDADDDLLLQPPAPLRAKKISTMGSSVSLFPQPSAPPLNVKPSAPPEEKPIEPSAPPLTDDELSETSEESERSEFQCPLTFSKMKTPVICTLDGISYEASVLQAAMLKYGRTPTNIPVAEHDIPKVIILNTNLQNAIKRYRANESERICYQCPITGQIMQEAVFCTLDKLSYEQAAIEDYLSKHGETPGGIKLPDGITLDAVLIPNRTLRKAIDSYQKPHLDNMQKSTMRP